MNESSIRDFFLGKLPPELLAKEAQAAIEPVDAITTKVHVREMDDSFIIGRDMAVRLCDAVLADEMAPHLLQPLAFALIGADSFTWDDELLGDVLFDRSAPEINYPLTQENIQRFRRWLLEEEPYPQHAASAWQPREGSVISRLIKVRDEGDEERGIG